MGDYWERESRRRSRGSMWYKHATLTGRVVYDRPPHPFKVSDVMRILRSVLILKDVDEILDLVNKFWETVFDTLKQTLEIDVPKWLTWLFESVFRRLFDWVDQLILYSPDPEGWRARYRALLVAYTPPEPEKPWWMEVSNGEDA